MEPASTAKVIETGVTIGVGVYEILKERGVWDKVKDYFAGREPHDVLILGASGTGKSAFLRTIQGLNPYIPRGDRTDSVTPVTGKIGEAIFRFIDTPGEDEHKDKRRKAILEAYNRSPLGIINVVSYGYHEGTARKDAALRGLKPDLNFLKERQKVEIDRLDEWTSTLCGRGGPASYLITVATKADLWWGSNGEDQPVLNYYRSGPYFEALGEAKQIIYSVRPCSSLNQLYYGVGAMSGYYPDQQRKDDWDSLIALLMERSSEQGSN